MLRYVTEARRGSGTAVPSSYRKKDRNKLHLISQSGVLSCQGHGGRNSRHTSGATANRLHPSRRGRNERISYTPATLIFVSQSWAVSQSVRGRAAVFECLHHLAPVNPHVTIRHIQSLIVSTGTGPIIRNRLLYIGLFIFRKFWIYP